MTWSEFLDYYKDLSVGIDDDDYFELMMRNAWHISGGEGNHANTSNLQCSSFMKMAHKPLKRSRMTWV